MDKWDFDKALAFARAAETDTIRRLSEFVAIQSISLDKAKAREVLDASNWFAAECRRIGLEHVAVHETAGLPIVTADWLHAGPDAPTVLLYAHVDVQPVEPLADWTVPPFAITQKDERLYGRGSTDDKGQLLMHMAALEALFRTGGGLPCNIRIVVDAEEEIGSPSLLPFMKAHPELFKADVAIVSDSPMHGFNTPSLACSLRGIVNIEVSLRSAAGDLHAGQFGGAIPNAARSLARMIAALHDENERVTVPGFYDGVDALSAEDRALYARAPFDEAEWLKAIGVKGTEGEAGFSTLERTWIRPTLEINGMFGGHTAAGMKAIVASTATAKIACRVVASQDPVAVQQKVVAHLRATAPANVECVVTPVNVVPPALVDHNNPVVRLAADSLSKAFGRETYLVRDGGAIPAVAHFKSMFGIDTILMGFGCPDENKHGPDEWLALLHFRKGIEALLLYWTRLRDIGTPKKEQGA